MDGYISDKGIELVDYCKIDVEGHELEVLLGMSRTIREERVKIIQFEYSGTYIFSGAFLADIFSFFETLPYSLYKLTPRGLWPVPRWSATHERFRYSNWIAVHRDKAALARQLVRPDLRKLLASNDLRLRA
jgi:hypothetical protein